MLSRIVPVEAKSLVAATEFAGVDQMEIELIHAVHEIHYLVAVSLDFVAEDESVSTRAAKERVDATSPVEHIVTVTAGQGVIAVRAHNHFAIIVGDGADTLTVADGGAVGRI